MRAASAGRSGGARIRQHRSKPESTLGVRCLRRQCNDLRRGSGVKRRPFAGLPPAGALRPRRPDRRWKTSLSPPPISVPRQRERAELSVALTLFSNAFFRFLLRGLPSVARQGDRVDHSRSKGRPRALKNPEPPGGCPSAIAASLRAPPQPGSSSARARARRPEPLLIRSSGPISLSCSRGPLAAAPPILRPTPKKPFFHSTCSLATTAARLRRLPIAGELGGPIRFYSAAGKRPPSVSEEPEGAKRIAAGSLMNGERRVDAWGPTASRPSARDRGP